MDPQLVGQLAQTIYVASATGVSESGGPTYGSPVARLARVETRVTQVRGTDGNLKTTSHWICTTGALGLNDRVWLPGADHTAADQAGLPISVDAIPDEHGATDHYETMV